MTLWGTIKLKATINTDITVSTGKVIFKINGKTVKDANGKVIHDNIDLNK